MPCKSLIEGFRDDVYYVYIESDQSISVFHNKATGVVHYTTGACDLIPAVRKFYAFVAKTFPGVSLPRDPPK